MSDQDPELDVSNPPFAPEAAASRKLTTYGSPSHPLAFTISIADDGAVGYTGILKPLCMKFIWTYGSDFRIGWLPEREGVGDDGEGDVRVRVVSGDEHEGWRGEEGWKGVGEGPVFWDRMVLVGPVGDPAGLGGRFEGLGVEEAVGKVLSCAGEGTDAKLHFSAEGSATFSKEQEILRAFHPGRDPETFKISTASPPLHFLDHASKTKTYALTTRSLFLTAHRDGLVPNLRAYVEGGRDLLRPYYVLVRSKAEDTTVDGRLAVRFTEWLGEDAAQGTLRGYGRVWEEGVPLFTGRGRKEIADEEALVGREW